MGYEALFNYGCGVGLKKILDSTQRHEVAPPTLSTSFSLLSCSAVVTSNAL